MIGFIELLYTPLVITSNYSAVGARGSLVG
jgi:hypothetical protein